MAFKLYLLSISFVLVNCSVTKREYRNGYHIDRFHKDFYRESGTNEFPATDNCKVKFHGTKASVENDRLDFVSPGSDVSLPVLYLQQQDNSKDTCADTIKFKNGKEQRVKILDTHGGKILYHLCDNSMELRHAVTKDSILLIKYASGRTELYKKDDSENIDHPIAQTDTRRKLNKNALVSFLCVLLLVPLGFAPLFGIAALVQIDKNPGRYRGKWMAVLGTIAGGIAYLSVFVLFIVAIFQGS